MGCETGCEFIVTRPSAALFACTGNPTDPVRENMAALQEEEHQTKAMQAGCSEASVSAVCFHRQAKGKFQRCSG